MCLDPNRVFLITVPREQMSISSYEDDAFGTVSKTGAGGIPALA